MKKIILLLSTIMIYSCTSRNSKINQLTIRDGFYEVMALISDSTHADEIPKHQVLISFDTLFNPEDFTKVLVDTSEYVPLELKEAPTTEQLSQLSSENKKLLSISFTPKGAKKIKAFTAKRIMREVVIVLDGKAITMHKIRDTITGDKMQITRCGDNACEYLYLKMKEKVKK